MVRICFERIVEAVARGPGCGSAAAASCWRCSTAALRPFPDLSRKDRNAPPTRPNGRGPTAPAPGHRLGGYPTVVHHDALESDAGSGASEGWRLLLQLASDDPIMWGTDTGRLYLLVHEEDLARPERVRGTSASTSGCHFSGSRQHIPGLGSLAAVGFDVGEGDTAVQRDQLRGISNATPKAVAASIVATRSGAARCTKPALYAASCSRSEVWGSMKAFRCGGDTGGQPFSAEPAL